MPLPKNVGLKDRLIQQAEYNLVLFKIEIAINNCVIEVLSKEDTSDDTAEIVGHYASLLQRELGCLGRRNEQNEQ